MNLPNIKFIECNTPELLEELKKFATTFDPPHFISDNPDRLVIAVRDGVWIGYSEIAIRPVVFSAWSTRCKPVDIWAGMLAFCGWGNLQFGSGFTAVPLDTKTFPESIMKKLGFYRLKQELYRTQ